MTFPAQDHFFRSVPKTHPERIFLEGIEAKLSGDEGASFLQSLGQKELEELRVRASSYSNPKRGQALAGLLTFILSIGLLAWLFVAMTKQGTPLFHGVAGAVFGLWFWWGLARKTGRSAGDYLENVTEGLEGDTETTLLCLLFCARSAKCESYRNEVTKLNREFIVADARVLSKFYREEHPEHNDEDDEDGDADKTLLEKHGPDLLRRPIA